MRTNEFIQGYEKAERQHTMYIARYYSDDESLRFMTQEFDNYYSSKSDDWRDGYLNYCKEMQVRQGVLS